MKSSPLLLLVAATAGVGAPEPFDSDDPLDADFRTGMPIGKRIPEFGASGPEGKRWDFEAIRSPRLREESVEIPLTFSYKGLRRQGLLRSLQATARDRAVAGASGRYESARGAS